MDHTFAEAAASYVDHGGEGRYLPRILPHLGDLTLEQVTPMLVQRMAVAEYTGCLSSTRNRHFIVPTSAVMYHAHDLGWCRAVRMRRLRPERDLPPRPGPATEVWLWQFLRRCDTDRLPHLAALVLFMYQTGARISEAVALQWDTVDLPRRRATLLRTKTTGPHTRHLPDDLVARMTALPQDPGVPVFRYTSRFSVAERMARVCERAGIEYKSPHLAGRHAFATMCVSMGVPTRVAMDAGGWRSSVVFLERYVHTVNAGRQVAHRFNEERDRTGFHMDQVS